MSRGQGGLIRRASVGLVILCLYGVASLGHADYLTNKDIKLIRKHWPDYKYASDITQVPVEILAAIHYRESGLLEGYYSKRRQCVVKNIGGPFMLDLGPRNDGAEFARRIRNYEYKVWRFYGWKGTALRVRDNFRFAALVAAHELKSKFRTTLADAVYGYNGRSILMPLEVNPYVWNNPRAGIQFMVRYNDLEYLDTRPGVMVIYEEIKSRHIAGAN